MMRSPPIEIVREPVVDDVRAQFLSMKRNVSAIRAEKVDKNPVRVFHFAVVSALTLVHDVPERRELGEEKTGAREKDRSSERKTGEKEVWVALSHFPRISRSLESYRYTACLSWIVPITAGQGTGNISNAKWAITAEIMIIQEGVLLLLFIALPAQFQTKFCE